MATPKGPHRFTVVGTSGLPVDMLRYDGAYPAGSRDVLAITACIQGERRSQHDANGPGPFTIDLISERHPPTVDRWRSFGWYVR